MKLNSCDKPTPEQAFYSQALAVNSSLPKPQINTWVHLLELPSEYSFDEALLLCQQSEDEWVAWIPEHGEAVLNTRQFAAI